jgi:hypothetical protein
LPALEVEVPVKPLLEADQQAAMDRVVQRIRQQSSDRESFTLLLLQELLRESQDQDVLFLLNSYSGDSLEIILHSLASAGIPAHELRGIELEDGRRRQTLSSLIEVRNGLLPIPPLQG